MTFLAPRTGVRRLRVESRKCASIARCSTSMSSGRTTAAALSGSPSGGEASRVPLIAASSDLRLHVTCTKVKPLSVFRFALSVFRCKTGPPGVPYTPGCSVAVRLPLGVPLPSGPPRCSGFFRSPSVFRCAPRPSAFCSVLLLAISARVTLRGGYKKCRLQ